MTDEIIPELLLDEMRNDSTKKLEDSFTWAKRWGCIVMLNQADTILQGDADYGKGDMNGDMWDYVPQSMSRASCQFGKNLVVTNPCDRYPPQGCGTNAGHFYWHHVPHCRPATVSTPGPLGIIGQGDSVTYQCQLLLSTPRQKSDHENLRNQHAMDKRCVFGAASAPSATRRSGSR